MSAVTQPEVGNITDGPGSAARALEHRREAGTIALLERQADLATLTDEEFERRLAQAKTGYGRLQRIFDTLMVDGVHYGTKDYKGTRNVFKTPDLTQEGGQLLRQ